MVSITVGAPSLPNAGTRAKKDSLNGGARVSLLARAFS
eukprot:SAG11_NODE_3293_length_2547_cov_2.467729_1_plen_38_part_00